MARTIKKKLPKYYEGVNLNYRKPNLTVDKSIFNPIGSTTTTPTQPFNTMGAVGAIGGVAGGLLDNATQQTTTDADGVEYKTQDNAAAFGSGALKGAAAGAMLGPWGAAGGALLYGTASLFMNQSNTDKVNKAKQASLTRRNELAYDNAVTNQANAEAQGFRKQGQQYVGMYKKGGYLKYPDGGELPKDKKIKLNFEDSQNEIDYKTGKPTGRGALVDANLDIISGLNLAGGAKRVGKVAYDTYKYGKPGIINLSKNYKPSYAEALKEGLKTLLIPFANGGELTPEYEVEGNEVVQGADTQLEGQEQLASDMHKAVGPSHEAGGVLGQGGDRVFSDRLYPSSHLNSTLSALKIRTGKNPTYANLAEKLGKLKGKYEEKVSSNNPLTHNTGKAMLGRVDGAIEAVFQDQELQKENQSVKKYADGGKLPDWNTLGNENYVPDNSPVRIGNDPKEYIPKETVLEEPVKKQVVEKIVNNPTFDLSKHSNSRIKSLDPDSNAIKAFDFFVDKGFTKESAAGIVGNLWHESGGLQPNIKETKKDGTRGPGYGIAQWTTADRKKALEDYAKSEGKDKSDLLLQLEFLFKEMSEGKIAGRDVTKEFKKIVDIDKATSLFESTMERAKIKNMSARKAYAKDIYKLYDNQNKPKYAMGGKIKRYYGGGDIEALRKMYPTWSGSDEDLYKLAVSKGYKPTDKVSNKLKQDVKFYPPDNADNANPPEEDLPSGNLYNNESLSLLSSRKPSALPVTNKGLSYPNMERTNAYIKPTSKSTNREFTVQGNNPADGTWKENQAPYTNSADKAKLFDFTGGNTDVNTYTGPEVTGKTDYSDINKFLSPEQGINTMVYLANLKRGDKQQTGFMPEVAAPSYMRNVNMLPYNKYMISKEAQTMGRNIDMSSGNTQDRFARRMAVKGEAMDKINAATASQAERDMAVSNTNTQITNEYKARKADAKNKYLEMKLTGENAKLTNRQAATNAWLQGIMGNLASGRAYEVEKEKMQIARMNGGRGTAERSDSGLDFIKRYNLKRKGGYINK